MAWWCPLTSPLQRATIAWSGGHLESPGMSSSRWILSPFCSTRSVATKAPALFKSTSRPSISLPEARMRPLISPSVRTRGSRRLSIPGSLAMLGPLGTVQIPFRREPEDLVSNTLIGMALGVQPPAGTVGSAPQGELKSTHPQGLRGCRATGVRHDAGRTVLLLDPTDPSTFPNAHGHREPEAARKAATDPSAEPGR